MSASIYRISNLITNDFYVGVTIRALSSRFNQHKSDARNSKRGYRLHNAIRKYGESAFAIELIEVVSSEHVHDREMYWIAELKPTYNLTAGGEGTLSPSDETRAKMRAAKLGKPLSDEVRKNMSLGRTGKPLSESHRRRMSEVRMGVRPTEETRAKLRASHMGIRPSTETRRKMGLSQKGRVMTEETKQKLRDANKGQVPWNKGLKIGHQKQDVVDGIANTK